jgi:alpha 1,2-mannosyltransferase
MVHGGLAYSRRVITRFGAIFILLFLFATWRWSQPTISFVPSINDLPLNGLPLDEKPLEAAPVAGAPPTESTIADLPKIETPATPIPVDHARPPLPSHAAERWSQLRKTFIDHNPGRPEITRGEKKVKETGFADDAAKTWERPDLLVIDISDVSRAQKQHSNLVSQLPDLSHAFTFEKGSRGIVTSAGGALLPVLIVSLKMLRRTGNSLPVEVFLADDSEYEAKLCEVVLPSLNAKCLLLEDPLFNALPPQYESEPLRLTKYQTKPFAILFSSFEEVLFLDADNFPVTDPTSLFDSKPFQKTGLITWPDYWCVTQSPLYYQIAGVDPTPVTKRSSTESGQIMYDKTRHISDLLLACYYTYYGPDLYFPLLTQGYPGEGDKETYLAAAEVMNATFYNTNQPPGILMHKEHDGGINGVAMTQVDPVEDYALAQANKSWRDKESKHAFIHHHHPKLNALEVMGPHWFNWGEYPHDRMWGSEENIIEKYGLDLEKELWKAISYTACDLEKDFKNWEGHDGICDSVKQHQRLVFGLNA